jgi:hypothetical protein
VEKAVETGPKLVCRRYYGLIYRHLSKGETERAAKNRHFRAARARKRARNKPCRSGEASVKAVFSS